MKMVTFGDGRTGSRGTGSTGSWAPKRTVSQFSEPVLTQARLLFVTVVGGVGEVFGEHVPGGFAGAGGGDQAMVAHDAQPAFDAAFRLADQLIAAGPVAASLVQQV